MRRPLPSLAAFAIYLAMAVWRTWPLAASLGTHVASDPGDAYLLTWILAWDVYAVLTETRERFRLAAQLLAFAGASAIVATAVIGLVIAEMGGGSPPACSGRTSMVGSAQPRRPPAFPWRAPREPWSWCHWTCRRQPRLAATAWT